MKKEKLRTRHRILADLEPAPKTKLISTMSRLAREKHVERIIRAMHEVLRSCPEACFLVLGDGPERPNLVAEAQPGFLGGVVARVLAKPALAGSVARRARTWVPANLLTLQERQALEVDLIERTAHTARSSDPPTASRNGG